jgi:hypothetical protein
VQAFFKGCITICCSSASPWRGMLTCRCNNRPSTFKCCTHQQALAPAVAVGGGWAAEVLRLLGSHGPGHLILFPSIAFHKLPPAGMILCGAFNQVVPKGS